MLFIGRNWYLVTVRKLYIYLSLLIIELQLILFNVTETCFQHFILFLTQFFHTVTKEHIMSVNEAVLLAAHIGKIFPWSL